MSDLPVVRASDADRELAVTRLRDATADGRLTLEEFTDRMHAVYAARTHDELDTLLRDLPERSPDALPAKRRAVSVMGNSTLDLRGFAGEVEVRVLCVMGNVTVLVSHDAHVELSAVAFMGNKEVRGQREDTGDGARILVTGLVVMGNVEVRRR